MVTYAKPVNNFQYEFSGLSTDTKPTQADYPDMRNGSTFMEIDTKTLYFWDAEGQTWV